MYLVSLYHAFPQEEEEKGMHVWLLINLSHVLHLAASKQVQEFCLHEYSHHT